MTGMGRKGMPRGPRYTPEEDAIIMAHHATADAQATLRAAGYERGLDSIRARKKELRKKTLTGEQLFAERESLMGLYRLNRRERQQLEERLIEVSLSLRAQERMEAVEELSADDREAVTKRVEEILTQLERDV